MIPRAHRPRPSRHSVVLAIAAAAQASPALAQHLGGGADVDVPWWRVAAVLVLCVLMAGAAIYAARFRLFRNAGTAAWPSSFFDAVKLMAPAPRRLKVIETVRLSHQVDICLVSCDDVEFIIAAGANGATVVAQPQGWPGARAA